ncbi:hypothetical protein AAU61_16225 [Desulfocarbo indianensis]|nr:hypothetical protein AAU61_16225 [Desulfocarbo indianensis]
MPNILAVDDSRLALTALKDTFTQQGLTSVSTAHSAAEALTILGVGKTVAVKEDEEFDLIILDIVMPDMDGIKACKIIKNVDRLKDVPIIIVTSRTDYDSLAEAFQAGAMDYITKPIHAVELMARVHSALALKAEVDRRKAREQQLIEMTSRLSEANQELKRLSSLDGLTGVANRRLFDVTLEQEWRRSMRQKRSLALVMMDIDFFKLYNDHYGHQAGDECLKQVSAAIQKCLRRPADLLARYGGEEFVALLPDTDLPGAFTLAEYARRGIERLALAHSFSKAAPVVTVSLGVAAIIPENRFKPAQLLGAADQALYRAKEEGRNRAVTGAVEPYLSEKGDRQ